MKKSVLFLVVLFLTSQISAQDYSYKVEKVSNPYKALINLDKAQKSREEIHQFTELHAIHEYERNGNHGFVAEIEFTGEADAELLRRNTFAFETAGRLALVAADAEGLSKLSMATNVISIHYPTVVQKSSPENTPPALPSSSALGALFAKKEGINGTGINIAILDYEWNDWNSADRSNLPPLSNITEHDVDPGFFGGNGQGTHGTNCMEIIYKIAPSAKFYLYDTDGGEIGPIQWGGNIYNSLKHIRDNYLTTIDVISISMTTTGDIERSNACSNQIVDILNELREAGIITIVSSGNYSENHIYFENIPNNSVPDYNLFSSEGYFQFTQNGGVKTDYLEFEGNKNEILSVNGYVVSSQTNKPIFLIELYMKQEDGSFANLGIQNETGTFLFQINTELPTFNYYRLKIKFVNQTQNPQNYSVDIFFTGVENLHFRDSKASVLTKKYLHSYNSVSFPAFLPSVLAVGAVNYENALLEYSSGGSEHFAQIKPDFSSFSHVITPLTSNGLGFTGTSAAAPHLAGLVALILDRDNTPRSAQRFDHIKAKLSQDSRKVQLQKSLSFADETVYLSAAGGANYQTGHGIPFYKPSNIYADSYEPDNSIETAKELSNLELPLVLSNEKGWWQQARQFRSIHEATDDDYIKLARIPTLFGTITWVAVKSYNSQDYQQDLVLELWAEKGNNSPQFLYSNEHWNIDTIAARSDKAGKLNEITSGNYKFPLTLPIPATYYGEPDNVSYYIKVKTLQTGQLPILYEIIFCTTQEENHNYWGTTDFLYFSNQAGSVTLRPKIESNDGIAFIQFSDKVSGNKFIKGNPFDQISVLDPQNRVATYLRTVIPQISLNSEVTAYTFQGKKQTFPLYTGLQVTFPNGGEIVNINKPCTISWERYIYQGNVKITLMKNGLPVLNIASSVSGTSYIWPVPNQSSLSGSGYRIKIEATDGSFADESNENFTIAESSEGHDLAILNPTINKTWFTPGTSIIAKYFIRNYGIYPESNYTVEFKIRDASGAILSSSDQAGVSVGVNTTSQQQSKTISSSGLPEGFYTLTVFINLPTDQALGNNKEVFSFYIGSADPYNTFTYSNTALIPPGATQSLNGYSVKFINGNTNEINVSVNGETRRIQKFEVSKFDANRFFLIFEFITSNQAVLQYGTFTPETEFKSLDKKLIIEAGSFKYFRLWHNSTDPSIGYDFLEEGGEDFPNISGWSGSFKKAPFLDYNLTFKVTVPSTAQLRKYFFWVAFTINNKDYYQRFEVEVIAPQPDFDFLLSKNSFTLAKNRSENFQLALSPKNNFNELVYASISSLHSDVTVSFAQNGVTLPRTINGTISLNQNSTLTGSFIGEIILTSSTRTKTIPIYMDIVDEGNKYIRILGTSYADTDTKTDSLKIVYESVFNNAPTGQTANWQYTTDGINFTNIPEAQIINNLPKASGTDSITWVIPVSPVLQTTNAKFRMQQRAGAELFSIVTTTGNTIRYADFDVSTYANGYLHVIDSYSGMIMKKYKYENNQFTYVSQKTINAPANFGDNLIYCYNRFYLHDAGDNRVYIYDQSFNYITNVAVDGDYKILCIKDNKLYTYYRQSASIYTFLELNNNIQPTGLQFPSIPTIPYDDFSFNDGKNIWFGGSNFLLKIAPDLLSYTYYNVPVRMYSLTPIGNLLIGVGDQSNSTLIALNFVSPYTLPSTSNEFLLNNTYTPSLANKSIKPVQEDSTATQHIALDTLISDPDTPFGNLQINISSSGDIFRAQRNSSSPTHLDIIPYTNEFGRGQFTIAVSDGYNSSSRQYSVDVLPVNDPPTITPLPDLSFLEDREIPINIRDYLNDPDDSSHTLQLSYRVLAYNSPRLPTDSIIIRTDSLQRWIVSGTPNFNQPLGAIAEISVRDTAGGQSYDTIMIVIHPSNDPPTTFSKKYPLDKSENPSTVLLRWTASHDVDGDSVTYHIRLQSNLADTLLTTRDTSLSLQLPFDSTAAPTEYAWQIIATDGSFEIYSNDTLRSFRIVSTPSTPNLLTPADSATGIITPLLFQWTASPMARFYRLQLSEDSTFSTSIYMDTMLTGTSLSVSPIEEGKRFFWRIQALNTLFASSWSSILRFTTLSKPKNIALLSPSQGAMNVRLPIQFAWTAGEEIIPAARNVSPSVHGESGSEAISNYWLSISTDSLFGTIAYTDSSITGLQTSVSVLANNTTFYWRVRAKNELGWGMRSATGYFTTIVAIPETALLHQPENHVYQIPQPILLRWGKAQRAEKYILQVSLDAGFNQIFIADSTLTDTLYQLPPLNPATTYFWRITAVNIAGYGQHSTTWDFRTQGYPAGVELVYPPHNATDLPVANLIFSWKEAGELLKKNLLPNHNMEEDADVRISETNSISDNITKNVFSTTPSPLAPSTIGNYWMQITSDTGSAAIFYEDSTLTDTVKSLSGFNYLTQYYWRIKAKNQTGWGEFCSWRRFETIIERPEKPHLFSPLPNTTGAIQPLVLIWHESRRRDAYTVEMSTDLFFTNIIVRDTMLQDTSRLIDGLNNLTTYYWRVYARNNGGISDTSDVWKFKTQGTPMTVSLYYPENQAQHIQTNVPFTWSRALSQEDLIRYALEIYHDTTETMIYSDTTLTDTTIVVQLAHDQLYYWRVRASNTSGWGNYSSWSTFTTIVPYPGQAIQVSPANFSFRIATTPTLRWRTSSYAENYHLQLSTDSLFSSYISNDSTLTDTLFTSDTLEYKAMYYWRFRSMNIAGHSAFSQVWSFRTVFKPIATPGQLTATASLPGIITLQWTDESDNETGFIIFRKEGDSSGSTPVIIIDTVAAATLAYADTTVSDSMQYSYQVIAFNEDTLSEYSNYATVTSLTNVSERFSYLIPSEFQLEQNYPNPFNPSTKVRYGLPSESMVRIELYDLSGQRVRTILEQIQAAGYYEIICSTEGLSSGIYFYVFQARETNGKRSMREARKMILAK